MDRNSPVPLYYQLAETIEHAITTGALAPGERLENELSLTSRLGLSRPTARQAIQELVQKGLLVRNRGVGTQVVGSQFGRDERLSSPNEDLAEPDRVPGTRVLEFRVGPLDPATGTPWRPPLSATPSFSRPAGCGWQFVEFGRHIYQADHYSIQSSLTV